ncbi:MAG: ATP synthase F1 subunit gamma [Deltaproteobacteria bacterium]|nr:ATP synthase F1 subunit gamma [Deltaproteobacteria bacterium]
MASLKDIKRRIGSVEKTQQITSAMRMVAAAKLRRAQDAIIAARPYAQKMFATLGEIGRRQKEADHPLLQEHAQARTLEVVVVTSDRGLCGAFNSNAIKRAEREIAQRGPAFGQVVLSTAGRKARDYFQRRREIVQSFEGGAGTAAAAEMAEHLAGRYESGEIDGALVIYNEFVSALTQRPRADVLLPLSAEREIAESAEAAEAAAPAESESGGGAAPYEIEPSARGLLAVLVPQALEFAIYRALLENQAGEHAARMAAMESATRNTEELIRNLTLQFNRVRQAAITRELVEIVSGAEAL